MAQVKTSVMIITKNRPKLLTACLKSLLQQTRLPDEVVVLDSSSQPQNNLLTNFQHHLNIQYFYEPVCNIPKAREMAFQRTSYNLALFLDDDCTAEKEWIAKMISLHRKNPQTALISGQLIHTPQNSLYAYLIKRLREHRLSMVPPKRRGLYFNIENCLLNKKLLVQHQIHFDPQMEREEFTDFALQIYHHHGQILLTNETKVYHHERNSLAKFLRQRFKNSGNATRLREKWTEELHFYGAQRASYLPLLTQLFKDYSQKAGLLAAGKLITVIFLSFLAYELGYFHSATFPKKNNKS